VSKYGRLKKDTDYYLAGTEFEIINEDDGFWSLNPFYSGKIYGRHVSFDQKHVDIIYDKSYTGKIVEAPKKEYPKEEWWEYTNYP
jgi:hypothetical protein